MKEQEWSKERIQVEMMELVPLTIRDLVIGILLLIGGVGILMSIKRFSEVIPVFIFILVGIGFTLGGIFLIKRAFGKNRQYKELKKKL